MDDSDTVAMLNLIKEGNVGVYCHSCRVVEAVTNTKRNISFVAFVTSDCLQIVKFYPEGNAQIRLQLRGLEDLYYYCNQHGLFKKKE